MTGSATHPAWSPSGRRIAFRHRYDIYTANPDGTKRRRAYDWPAQALRGRRHAPRDLSWGIPPVLNADERQHDGTLTGGSYALGPPQSTGGGHPPGRRRGFVVASVPEVPGAHSQGRSRKQARENVIDALRLRLGEHALAEPAEDSESLELTIAA